MNTEELIDNTIANLKIISMLQKNQKLSVRNGQLTLEHDDTFQVLRRWFFKDSRNLTLLHIRNTINNAIKLSKGIISGQVDIELKSWTLQKLASEMQHCQTGLTNLKTTYNNDAIVFANLDVIIDRLEANCKELNEYIKEKSD
jgi:DNA-binding Xre family transcriptional regulator